MSTAAEPRIKMRGLNKRLRDSQWLVINDIAKRLSELHRYQTRPAQQAESEATVDGFLAKLGAVTGDEHRAADEVFTFMDEHLRAGQFSVCDLAMSKVNLSQLLPSTIVSFLMVTRRAKDKLASRAAFIERGIDAVANRYGREEADALLRKYR